MKYLNIQQIKFFLLFFIVSFYNSTMFYPMWTITIWILPFSLTQSDQYDSVHSWPHAWIYNASATLQPPHHSFTPTTTPLYRSVKILTYHISTPHTTYTPTTTPHYRSVKISTYHFSTPLYRSVKISTYHISTPHTTYTPTTTPLYRSVKISTVKQR